MSQDHVDVSYYWPLQQEFQLWFQRTDMLPPTH